MLKWKLRASRVLQNATITLTVGWMLLHTLGHAVLHSLGVPCP